MKSLANQLSTKPKRKTRLKELAAAAHCVLKARQSQGNGAVPPRDLLQELSCTPAELRGAMQSLVSDNRAERVDGVNGSGHPEPWWRVSSPPAPPRPYVAPVFLGKHNSHLCGRCGQRAFGKSEKWRRKHRKKDCNENIVRFVLTV